MNPDSSGGYEAAESNRGAEKQGAGNGTSHNSSPPAPPGSTDTAGDELRTWFITHAKLRERALKKALELCDEEYIETVDTLTCIFREGNLGNIFTQEGLRTDIQQALEKGGVGLAAQKGGGAEGKEDSDVDYANTHDDNKRKGIDRVEEKSEEEDEEEEEEDAGYQTPDEDEGEEKKQDACYLQVGDALGKYTIARRLGSGAMGVVYEAFDSHLQRKVAIKIPQQPRSAARMKQESIVLAQLHHRNILCVFDFVEQTTTPKKYLVTELLSGKSLLKIIEKDPKKLTEKNILSVALGVLRALRKTHQEGFVHRDVKPANIMWLAAAVSECLVEFIRLVELWNREASFSPQQSKSLRVNVRHSFWDSRVYGAPGERWKVG
jgi:hypothetical protein